MAILKSNYSTLLDYANRVDPDGSAPVIVEMLNQTNPMLAEMPFKNGNLITGHKTTVRTGLPQGTWRSLYEGVQPTKSQTAQVTETVGNLEAFTEVDKMLVELAEDGDQFRLSEAESHIEGMGQQIASTLFYGNTNVNPERFMGFAPRFNTGDVLEAKNAVNVIDAGGRGSDNTSMWIVAWGEKKACGILPKNMTGLGTGGSIEHEDLGQETITKEDGSKYLALCDHFKITMGLAVEDWRYVVRIANIDVSELQSDPALGGANLWRLISQGLERIHMVGDTTTLYGNRTISSILREQELHQKTVRITTDQVGGKQVTRVADSCTLSRTDALINNEAFVPGF